MDTTFTATIIKDEHKGGWTYVIWPDSVACFGTRKPVKVKRTIDGFDFHATFLPWGDGTHMMPVKAAILQAIKKGEGDSVVVHLTERL